MRQFLVPAALLLTAATGAISSLPAIAHPGRTNASGCHNNRRTGDYHCHGGGSDSSGYGGGGGGDAAAPAAPVCSDEQTLRIAIKVYKTTSNGSETLWRSSGDVLINKGAAKLNGISGDLYTYDVQGTRIKNFVGSGGRSNVYAFDGSSWIQTVEQTKDGNTVISRLEANDLGISSEHYSETTSTRQVCR